MRNKSSKKIIILGVAAVSVSILTTVISLIIYHNSGDIYLDRSRPGYLPDESEVENEPESNYTFSSSGPITEEVLNDYITHFEEALNYIDDLDSPFSEAPLSDESLGIPAAPAPSDNPSAE